MLVIRMGDAHRIGARSWQIPAILDHMMFPRSQERNRVARAGYGNKA